MSCSIARNALTKLVQHTIIMGEYESDMQRSSTPDTGKESPPVCSALDLYLPKFDVRAWSSTVTCMSLVSHHQHLSILWNCIYKWTIHLTVVPQKSQCFGILSTKCNPHGLRVNNKRIRSISSEMQRPSLLFEGRFYRKHWICKTNPQMSHVGCTALHR